MGCASYRHLIRHDPSSAPSTQGDAMSGFLMILAVLSLIGGMLGAVISLPSFLGFVTYLSCGVVSFALFAWMSRILDNQAAILSALVEIKNQSSPNLSTRSGPLFNIGDNVRHPVFGAGNVASSVGNGRYLVIFTDGHQTLPASELRREIPVSTNGTLLSESSKTCPKCYALLPLDATQCKRCGHYYLLAAGFTETST